MIEQTKNKSTLKGVLIKYNFKNKCKTVAGFCPDCDSIVSYLNETKTYICLNPDCDFEADSDCIRISKEKTTNEIQNSI